MIINTDRAECTACHIPIDIITSQTVVDETSDGLVVLCVGICPICHEWHEWYAHYGYKGYMGLEKTRGFHARG